MKLLAKKVDLDYDLVTEGKMYDAVIEQPLGLHSFAVITADNGFTKLIIYNDESDRHLNAYVEWEFVEEG